MQQNPQELYLIWNYIEPPLIREPEQSSPPNQELFYLDSVCDLASFTLFFFFSLPLLLHHLLLALCCFLSFSLLETKQRDRKKERKKERTESECERQQNAVCVGGWVDDEAVGVVGRCGGEGWFQQWLRSSCQRDRWNESSWPKHTESFSTPRSFLLGVSSASTSGLLLLHQLPGSVIDSGNNWAVDVMIRFALFCWR